MKVEVGGEDRVVRVGSNWHPPKKLLIRNPAMLQLSYFEHFLVLGSAVSGCVSISGFASLVNCPVGIASSAVGLKICVTIKLP